MKRLLWVICVGLVLSGCGREKARQQKIEYDTLHSLVFPSFLTEVYGDSGFAIAPGRTLAARSFELPVGMTARQGFCRVFDNDPELDQRVFITKSVRQEVCEGAGQVTGPVSIEVSGCLGGYAGIGASPDVGEPAVIEFSLSCQPPRKLNGTATTSYG